MSYVTFEKTGSSAITYKEHYFSPKKTEEGVVNYSWLGRQIRRILNTCLCGLYKSPEIVECKMGNKTLYLDFKSLNNWYYTHTSKELKLADVKASTNITSIFDKAFSSIKIPTDPYDWEEEKDVDECKVTIETHKNNSIRITAHFNDWESKVLDKDFLNDIVSKIKKDEKPTEKEIETLIKEILEYQNKDENRITFDPKQLYLLEIETKEFHFLPELVVSLRYDPGKEVDIYLNTHNTSNKPSDLVKLTEIDKSFDAEIGLEKGEVSSYFTSTEVYMHVTLKKPYEELEKSKFYKKLYDIKGNFINSPENKRYVESIICYMLKKNDLEFSPDKKYEIAFDISTLGTTSRSFITLTNNPLEIENDYRREFRFRLN